jgi:hypothetical protein
MSALGLLEGVIQGSVECEGSKIRISSGQGPRVLVDVLRRLDAGELEPATMSVREPSLDDVFLRLTGRHAEAGSGEEQGVARTGGAA